MQKILKACKRDVISKILLFFNRSLIISFIISVLGLSGCDANIVEGVIDALNGLAEEKRQQENQKNILQQESRYQGSLENKPVYLEEDKSDKKKRYFNKIFPNEFDVMGAVDKQSFEALEAHFKKINSKIKNDDSANTERKYVRSYIGFRNTDPRLENIYHAWVEKYPESSAAHTARGLYYKNVAWAKRGGKFMADTEDHQVRGMNEFIDFAKSDLFKAIDINEGSLMAYDGLISLTNLTSDNLNEKEIRDKVLSIFPKSFTIRSSLIFSLQPKWGGSFKKLKSFIEECENIYDEGDSRLNYFRNYIHYVRADIQKRESREDAIALYNTAVGSGNQSFYLYARGSNYYYLKEYEKSLKDLDKAVEISPYKYSSRLMRARALKKLGRYEEALENISIALEIDAFDEDYLRARGELHRTLGNYKLAEIDFTNSLVYGSTEKWNWHLLAEVYLFDYKNYQEGEKVAKKALVFHPEDELLWYDLAIAQSQIFNCEVMDTFNEFLKLCKKQDCSEQNINWIKNSQEIFKQRKFCS